MEMKFNRQELYELVWSKSMLALSKEYNISDVGLRKLCKRMKIPVPLVGHWQKVQHGRTPTKKALLSDYSGDEDVTLQLREPGSGGATGFESPLTILHHQILNDPSLPLTVADRLSAKDELIADVKNDLTAKQYRPTNGIITSAGGNLDITVSPRNLSRALRFMAALVKLLKARGHTIKIESHQTFVIVEGEDIQLSLRERSSKVEGVESWQDGYTRPTGILSLQMKQSYHLMEAKDGTIPLEGQLAKILAKIELKGKDGRLWREQRQREREEQEALEKIEKERKQREDKELEDFKSLIRRAQRWNKTRMLRDYIEAVKASSSPEFIQWAAEKCDWYDPLVEREDKLLQEIDRETLAPVKKPFSFNW